MATQFVEGRFRGENAAGAPLSGGRLYTYAVGTTTHQATYTDYTLATQNTYVNDGAGGLYIALDSRGECSVWLGAGLTYSFALKDSTGASIWTDDGIKAKADAATTADTATTATTATKATNLAAGGAGRVPYQSAADTTLFTAAGTSGQTLVSGGTGAPTWTSAPDFTTQASTDNSTKAATTAFVQALAVNGTYTPTFAVVAPTTSVTLNGTNYIKVGNTVFGSMVVQITGSTSGAQGFTFTLPVSKTTNFGTAGVGNYELQGGASRQGSEWGGYVEASPSTKLGSVTVYPSTTPTSVTYSIWFSYNVT